MLKAYRAKTKEETEILINVYVDLLLLLSSKYDTDQETLRIVSQLVIENRELLSTYEREERKKASVHSTKAK